MSLPSHTYDPGDHEIELSSGAYLDLTAPDPAVITLDVIAHALSNTCRYTGHVSRFYSVAEHACLVAAKLREDGEPLGVQLAGLHHDDHEAFTPDVARPLKSLLQPAYGQIADRLDSAIWTALDLPDLGRSGHGQFAWAVVKAADNWALACEAYHLLPSRGCGWFCDGLYDPDNDPVAWTGTLGQPPLFARQMFRQAHDLLLLQMREVA